MAPTLSGSGSGSNRPCGGAQFSSGGSDSPARSSGNTASSSSGGLGRGAAANNRSSIKPLALPFDTDFGSLAIVVGQLVWWLMYTFLHVTYAEAIKAWFGTLMTAFRAARQASALVQPEAAVPLAGSELSPGSSGRCSVEVQQTASGKLVLEVMVKSEAQGTARESALELQLAASEASAACAWALLVGLRAQMAKGTKDAGGCTR